MRFAAALWTIILLGVVPPAASQEFLQDSPLVQAAQQGKLAERFKTYARMKAGMSAPDIAASQWFNTDSAAEIGNRPCVAKLPILQKYADQFGPALTVIGVHYAEKETVVAGSVAQHRIRFPVALDTGETWQIHSIDYTPTYLLIDKSGVVRFKGNLPPQAYEIAALISDDI